MLAIIGAAVVLCAAIGLVIAIVNPFGGQPADRLSIAINTPYVGQGVETGTAVVMHGVKVGQVTDVSGSPGGGVRLVAQLQQRPAETLTDTMGIDFRPINYFGVPGINLVPSTDGQVLRNGSEITLVPKGNFTLSQLLSQLGDVSAGALTPKLISVIDRVTRYTDGLNPLFETAVIATTAVADVQTVSTAQLLANTATASSAFPHFADGVVDAGTRIIDFDYPGGSAGAAATGPRVNPPYLEGVKVNNFQDETEDYFKNVYIPFVELQQDGLFASVGKLESSHVDDLLPLVDGITALTDTVPPLLRPQDIAATLAELRSRFEKLYAGNGEQRAMSVRVVLDRLPGVAAPMGIVTEGGS